MEVGGGAESLGSGVTRIYQTISKSNEAVALDLVSITTNLGDVFGIASF